MPIPYRVSQKRYFWISLDCPSSVAYFWFRSPAVAEGHEQTVKRISKSYFFLGHPVLPCAITLLSRMVLIISSATLFVIISLHRNFPPAYFLFWGWSQSSSFLLEGFYCAYLLPENPKSFQSPSSGTNKYQRDQNHQRQRASHCIIHNPMPSFPRSTYSLLSAWHSSYIIKPFWRDFSQPNH